MKITGFLKESFQKGGVDAAVNRYERKFKSDTSNVAQRLDDAASMNQAFYSLVTDFYLHAWGRSFHFGMRKKGESFKDSLLRHEYFLADKLHLLWNEKCLDLGCGVGGPMVNIAKQYKASITGINNTTYQIALGKKFLKEAALGTTCSFIECDWMKIPLEDSTFDKAYSIEATCHASDRRADVFKEVHRVLKPGALFGGYDWVLLDSYDSGNPEHRTIKHDIELGNGISNLNFTRDVTKALEQAGFEILECRDMAIECDPETPWYLPLQGEGISLQSLRKSPVGRKIMRGFFYGLEKSRLLPKGTLEVSRILNIAGEALVKGGEKKIFTPMLFFLARRGKSLPKAFS